MGSADAHREACGTAYEASGPDHQPPWGGAAGEGDAGVIVCAPRGGGGGLGGRHGGLWRASTDVEQGIP